MAVWCFSVHVCRIRGFKSACSGCDAGGNACPSTLAASALLLRIMNIAVAAMVMTSLAGETFKSGKWFPRKMHATVASLPNRAVPKHSCAGLQSPRIVSEGSSFRPSGS